MKELINEYNIILDYKKNSKNPSRLFYAMAQTIDSIKKADQILARTINRNFNYEMEIIEIKEGSIFTTLRTRIEGKDNEDLGYEAEIPDDKLKNYFRRSKRAITQKMLEFEKIEDAKQVESIKEDVFLIAKEEGVADSFGYCPPSLAEITDIVEYVSENVKDLEPEESLTYQDGPEIFEFPKKINIDKPKLEDSIITSSFKSTRSMIIKIKRPDYLGDSKWEFRHGTQRIDASIEDMEWLERFRSKEIPLTPGDSFEVEMEIDEHYDKHGNLVKSNYLIRKVGEIIPGEIDE